jgi:hypothetical protein
MKNIRLSIAVLFMALTTAILSSCVKGEFDEPPINIPETGLQATMTIAEFKQWYLDQATPLVQINDSMVIKGIVTANDKSGNLYKKMEIQDATAAIELSIDQTSLFNDYKVGQLVFISLKGLYVGNYNNLIQVGFLYNGSIGRLPSTMIEEHIYRDSLPGLPPVPDTMTIAELGEAAMNNMNVSKLIALKNVTFTDIGEVFAPQDVDATDRTLSDMAGKSIIVRTSKYSDFSGDTIPIGYGTVTGILSLYRSTWQLTLRSAEDVANFVDTIPPTPGAGTGTFEDPYNVLKAISNTSSNPVWVKGYIVGVYETGGTDFVPSFTAPFTTETNILIADSPTETSIGNCVPVQLPAGEIRTTLNLAQNATNQCKEVMVLGTLESYFSMPGVKNLSGYWFNGNGIIPATGFFTEEFNNGVGAFTAVNVLGEQVWVGQTYDGGCVTMSGFVNPNRFANEDWLISPALDLTGKTGVKMIFREAMNFAGNINEEAKVFVSLNYTGSGDPNDADWTELTGFTRSPGNSWSFVDTSPIDLSAYDGKTIYVGFKYISTTSVAGTWEISRMLLTSSSK